MITSPHNRLCLIPLLPWAGIRLDEMGFSDNPKVVFSSPDRERECRVWNAELYDGAAPFTFPKIVMGNKTLQQQQQQSTELNSTDTHRCVGYTDTLEVNNNTIRRPFFRIEKVVTHELPAVFTSSLIAVLIKGTCWLPTPRFHNFLLVCLFWYSCTNESGSRSDLRAVDGLGF